MPKENFELDTAGRAYLDHFMLLMHHEFYNFFHDLEKSDEIDYDIWDKGENEIMPALDIYMTIGNHYELVPPLYTKVLAQLRAAYLKLAEKNLPKRDLPDQPDFERYQEILATFSRFESYILKFADEYCDDEWF